MTKKQRKALNKETRRRPEWQATTRKKVREHPGLASVHANGNFDKVNLGTLRWKYHRLLRALGHKLIYFKHNKGKRCEHRSKTF